MHVVKKMKKKKKKNWMTEIHRETPPISPALVNMRFMDGELGGLGLP